MSQSQRRRAGRKRQSGPRSPNGQLSRRVTEALEGQPPTAVIRLVQESLRGCAEQAYGAPLGRLFLAGKLTAAEFEAGKRWDRLVRRYHFAIGAPLPDPRAASFALIDQRGPTPAPDPDSAKGRQLAELDRQIVDACLSAHAVVAAHGLRAEADMRRLCEGLGEYPAGVEALARAKAALSSLARHWGLSPKPEPLRKVAV